MPVNPFALTDGVPEARVGDRLVQARRDAGMGRWHASRAAQVSRSNLVRIERGRMRPPDGTVIALCRTYDVAVSWLVPERSGNEVVVGAGRIEVAGRSRRLTGAGASEGDHAVEAVLGSYLAIVRELRGVAAGGLVSLRDEDLVALARALGDTPSEIEARLVDLMKLSRDEARAVRRELLKRRVAVPAAGLLLATAAVTGSLDAGSGGGGAVDRAGGATFGGVHAEHTVDQAAAGTRTTTGRTDIAAPPAFAGAGSPAAAPDVSVDPGDEVMIGDAVSFVRDTPPPATPRVVIPLPSTPEQPAVVDTPTPDTTVVADPGAGGAPGDDTGTVDTGTVDTGTVDTGTVDTGTVDTDTVDTGTVDTGAGGGAADENAHGANDNASPDAADAGGNSDTAAQNANDGAGVENAHGANQNASSDAADAASNDTGSSADNASDGAGTSSSDASGKDNAHGGNDHASGNAADGASNAGAGNERADAPSPASNGNGGGATNAHANQHA